MAARSTMKLQRRISWFRRAIQEHFDTLQSNKILDYGLKGLMMAIAVLATALMFPASQSFQFSNLRVGNVHTGKEIIAPFTFFIRKSEDELKDDRAAAAQEIPPVFVRSDSVEMLTFQELEDFFESIEFVRATVDADSVKLRRIRDILNIDSIIIEQANTRFFIAQKGQSSASSRTAETERAFQIGFAEFRQRLRRLVVDIYAIGVLDQSAANIAPHVKKISIASTGGEIIEGLGGVYKLDNYKSVALDKLRQTFPDNEVAVKIGYPIVTAFLRPNLVFDKTTTDERINAAVANVPLSKGIVLENERIVNAHEIITPEILEKLSSLAAATSEREDREGGAKLLLPAIGKLLTSSIALSFTLIFLFVARRPLFHDLKRMFMIFIILMLVIGAAFFLRTIDVADGAHLLIPIAVSAMLFTIFFDSRTAFVTTVSISVISAAIYGNDFGLIVILMFVGTISTFAVRQIQARSWTLKAILYTSVAYIIAITATELLKHTDFSELWGMWFLGILNGIFSPFLTYGFMVIFEYIFQLTTNSTLLELSDLNKPLLRELAIRAPGTYHHSIMVGNLSEAAAETVGGNALLTRVAAYYHDIGKMEKPEYFVENQKGGKNPHEKLTPSMSCLVLVNHVKRGLEIAEEYNLPKELRDFIPQHHGTNIIKFFYQKARESAEDSEINESDFRYHGPKPQTKEAGILMLADAVEAGSRTLKEPSVSRIRSMVSSFISERLADSELDECPITISELKQVRESFVNTLTGMFHGRIDYPKAETQPTRQKKSKPAIEI